ncbi:MAG: hypothetical protein QOD84_2400 [Acidobacteriaceae bacterium]|jgi:hypothetical protein
MFPAGASDFTRDHRLLAAICSEYVTHIDTGWEVALKHHPNIQLLVATADRHGVLPLLAHCLLQAGISCEIAQSRAREIAALNLRMAAENVRLIGALRSHGIQALAYKGPVLGQQLYNNLTLRQSRDIDILVAPADVLRARDIICQLGYRDLEESGKFLLKKVVSSNCEWQMRGTHSGTIIELHWALFPRYASIDLSVEELKRASVDIEIVGERLRGLDIGHLALALSAHGTKHFWHRLGWLVDFALVLRKSDIEGGDQLLRAAKRKGMSRILLITALLANKVLGICLPKTFEEAIFADVSSRVLACELQHGLQGPGPEDLLQENIFRLRTRERWSDRVKIVSRLAFTPGPQEWNWVRLPQWAEWLYRPVRIARAARYLPRIAQSAFHRRNSAVTNANAISFPAKAQPLAYPLTI